VAKGTGCQSMDPGGIPPSGSTSGASGVRTSSLGAVAAVAETVGVALGAGSAAVAGTAVPSIHAEPAAAQVPNDRVPGMGRGRLLALQWGGVYSIYAP
jgi:hypothetical protein